MRAIAVLVAACAVLLCGCTSPSHNRPDTPTSPSGDAALGPNPSVRVAVRRIEKFVEAERGLTFKRPVRVAVLGRRRFLARLHDVQGKPNPRGVEQTVATLSSLGLISPKVDLLDAFRTAYDAGTLGFYDFKTKRLYVRGHRATPGVRAVLAHELTHALTDQRFGLRRPAIAHDDQERSIGWQALTEGDAERVRTAYEATMTPADRAQAQQEEGGDQPAPDVPQVVLLTIGFPYAVGPRFLEAVETHYGDAGVDRAYRHPPVSSEQLLDPHAYFENDDPKHVAVPAADGHRLTHSDLGVLGFLLMLEDKLDPTTAQQAIVGWGGDQYVAWRAGNHRWCVRDTVVMDYAVAMDRLDHALTEWVAKSHGRARIESRGERTTFLSCSS
jgi:hypothetical protein